MMHVIKKFSGFCYFSAILLITVCLTPGILAAQSNNNKRVLIDAGFASADITPQFPIRMAGYAARLSSEADSILRPLAAKAFALGSDAQHPSVLLTVDLVGIPWRITKQVTDFLSKERGINPAQVAIFASHTHGGPEVGNLMRILQYRDGKFSDSLLPLQQLTHIATYTEQLIQQLKDIAVTALNNRKPSYISWGQGQALFAANRRTKGGPVDVALPIIKVTHPDGSLKGVFANYACHGTTLGGNMYNIHGDWIAEAHRMIESRHPGTVALIGLGCAGDANPAPRGTVENMEQHGKEIADNVDKLLKAQLQPLNAPPAGQMKWVKLPYAKIPDVKELIAQTKEEGVKGYNARLMLENLMTGVAIPTALDYPVQVWNFDDKMAMVNLAGEVVVDYAVRLKDRFGAEQLWVNGYSNDVPCYIPSRRILKEGGYEAETSMYWYNKPSPFAPEVEDIIVDAVAALMPVSFKAQRPATNQQISIQTNEDNSYHLTAWHAATKGKQIKYMPEWKAFGWFNTTDEAIWKLNMAKAGQYDVYLDWSVSDAAAGKSFEFIAGSKKIKGRVAPSGSWFTFATKKIGTVRLKAGELTAVVKSGSTKETGPMFDLRAIRLVPAK